MSELPGANVPITTEELLDHEIWDLNLAMNAVEEHVAYRLKDFLADQAQEQTSPGEGDCLT